MKESIIFHTFRGQWEIGLSYSEKPKIYPYLGLQKYVVPKP